MQRRATPAFTTAFAALIALAGCGGGGGGGRGGAGGSGLTGFGGFGLFDGGGLADGGGSTGTDGPPLTPAPPICGNGIVEAAEACDVTATGCAAGQRCSATCTCVAGPPAPTDSGSLIAQALAGGRIDYFTSLLYRAYLLAGDGRLPPEFDGDFTVAEDTALFLEISRVWSALTASQQQQLAPYVARPTDPTSVYSTAPTAAFFGDDDFLAAGGSDPIQCPALAGTTTPDWRYAASTHFVVWSCGSGDPATDPYAGKRQAVSALAEQVWALEVPGMGPPRDDDFPFDPNNQKRIDIYLVPLNECVRRANGVCAALTSGLLAGAVPDSPCDNSRGPLTSSGYVLMRLDLVPAAAPTGPSKARSDFAHEFFHLLTYGMNLDAQGGGCPGGTFSGFVGGRTSWLTEASATWAEWAYTPDDNPEYRGAQFDEYQQRIPTVDSLLDDRPGGANPAYAAFAYPLFLSQEAGGRMPFEDFWKTARGPRTREALDDYLHTRFSFDRHFRDFAVKMLNTTLPGNPLGPLLSAFDGAVPPDFPPANMLETVDLPNSDTDIMFLAQLAPLAAQYQPFTVPPEIHWVDIDLSGAGADLTMDVIANVKDQWKRRSPNGLRFTVCREDAADDIKELYLIIANTAHREGEKADEMYKVKTRRACPATFTGWIHAETTVSGHYTQDFKNYDQFEQQEETWTLGMEHMVDLGGGALFPGVDSTWHSTFSHHDADSDVDAPCEGSTTDAEGGGSALSPLAVYDAGNGQLDLEPIFNPYPNSFYVDMVTTYTYCKGASYTDTFQRRVVEQSPVVFSSLQLIATPGNPNRFSGTKVVSHSEEPRTGGSDLVDFTISWDITRTRH